jgi:hypothetical protein
MPCRIADRFLSDSIKVGRSSSILNRLYSFDGERAINAVAGIA